MLGGPVLRATAGAARIRTTPPITAAASRGRASAAPTAAIRPESLPAGRPMRQRSTLVPSRVNSPGATSVEVRTLTTTTTITVVAREISREPGTMKIETSIERNSVLPAKTVVRPAVRRVVRAATSGVAPPLSSSRKRETISRA